MRANLKISRREFLRQAAVAGTGVFVAACAQAQPSVTPQSSDGASPESATVSILIGPEASAGDVTPDLMFWQTLTEVTGVNFEILQVPEDSLGQQVSLRMASGDLPTLMVLDSPPDSGLKPFVFASKYGAEGVFTKLNEHIERGAMPNFKKMLDERPSGRALATAIDGNMYAAPWAHCYDIYPAMSIRGDLLEECGFIEDRHNPPPPLEVAKTVDDIYNALKCTQQSLGGTPVLGARNGPAYSFPHWGYIFGTAPGAYYNPATKKYEYGPLMSRYRVWVEFMKKIYDEGILHPEFATMSDETWEAERNAGKFGAVVDNNVEWWWKVKETVDVGRSFWVMSPTIDGERVLWPGPVFWRDTSPIAISSAASPEQIDGAIKALDYQYSTEGIILGAFGREGVDYQIDNGKICLLGTYFVGDYAPTAYCDGKKPAEDVSYSALGIKNWPSSISRIAYPEFLYPEWLFVYGDAMGSDITYRREQLAESGSMTDPLLPLTFTDTEQETLGQLQAPLDTFVLEETQKFIEGLRPLTDDEWNQFTARIQELNAQQLVDINNAALARVSGS
jgi:putative aldouronate transport system substrate-binding protein